MTEPLSEPETDARGWTDSEAYVQRHFAVEDDALLRIRRVMEEEGLPAIQLPAVTARTIQLLLRAVGARRVLEVGTLAGYSALWIVRALSDEEDAEGSLLTIEIDPDRATLARRMLEEAGVAERVEVRVGSALEVLSTLQPDGGFDAILLDADKEGLPAYLSEARRLLRVGGLLLVDNALWKGKVLDAAAQDEATEAIRTTHHLIAEDPSFDATLLTIGDGLLVALRR